MAPSSHLLHQPPEVYHAILLEVDTTDLASLSETCWQLRNSIAHDHLLWKRQYLKRFVRLTTDNKVTANTVRIVQRLTLAMMLQMARGKQD